MKLFKVKDKDGILSSLILYAILIISLTQIVLRTVLNLPLTGVEELLRYLFISLIFIGLPYYFRKNGHIRLEGMHKFFPASLNNALEMIIKISGVLVFVIISFSAIYTMITNFKSITPTISMPFWLFFLPTIIGFVLVTIEHIKELIKSLKKN
ncbi:MAG: TRAP transporter small permease [bacterium]